MKQPSKICLIIMRWIRCYNWYMGNDEILINQLFSGSYLEENENIGHEIINLFRADDENNYLYITPSGKIRKHHSIKSVIFVEHIKNKNTVEVIAKAEDLQAMNEEINGIMYAGYSLNDIFNKNTYHGIRSNQVNFTFRAGSVRLPKKRIILTLDDDYKKTIKEGSAVVLRLHSNGKIIVGQSARQYYSEKKDPDAYHELKKLLENKDFWETANTTECLNVGGSTRHISSSFLEIIRKENDELIFSNLLEYYFNYNHSCFQKFACEVLGIKNFGADFEIKRETENRIDLWIEGQQDILIIENKIKSDINGVKSKDYSQLNKYQDYAEKKINDPREDNSAFGKTSHYFIFVPDYNDLDIEKYCHDKKPYKIIKYSKIYDFFDKYTTEYVDEKYFADFLKGLKKHTVKKMSEIKFQTMKTRFLEKINQS